MRCCASELSAVCQCAGLLPPLRVVLPHLLPASSPHLLPASSNFPLLPADEEGEEGGGFFYNQDEVLAGAAQAALVVNDDVDDVRLESCRSRCCGRMHCFP
jgi:hypothetical protein